MNSIIFTHFATPPQGASSLDLAITRLGAWIDIEIGSLEELLETSGRKDAINDIEAIYRLHLEADSTLWNVEQLLQDAILPLERLLERVEKMPAEDQLAGQVPPDFDAWIRWSGARLEDILATLHWAIDA